MGEDGGARLGPVGEGISSVGSPWCQILLLSCLKLFQGVLLSIGGTTQILTVTSKVLVIWPLPSSACCLQVWGFPWSCDSLPFLFVLPQGPIFMVPPPRIGLPAPPAPSLTFIHPLGPSSARLHPHLKLG